MVSSTNKTERFDLIEILLKVALNTINSKLFIVKYAIKYNLNLHLAFKQQQRNFSQMCRYGNRFLLLDQ